MGQWLGPPTGDHLLNFAASVRGSWTVMSCHVGKLDTKWSFVFPGLIYALKYFVCVRYEYEYMYVP